MWDMATRGSHLEGSPEDDSYTASESESLEYSDEINSDIEAELYSQIHYSYAYGKPNVQNEDNRNSDTRVLNADRVKEYENGMKYTNEKIGISQHLITDRRAFNIRLVSNKNKFLYKKKFNSKPTMRNSTYGSVTISHDTPTPALNSAHSSVTHDAPTPTLDNKSMSSSESSDDVCVVDWLDSSSEDNLLTNVNANDSILKKPIGNLQNMKRAMSPNSGSSVDCINAISKTDLSAVTIDVDSSNTSSVSDETQNAKWHVDSADLSAITIDIDTSNTSSSTDEKQKAEWHVDSEDLINGKMSKKLRRRYYALDALRCKNCGSRAHSVKYCPEPRIMKCYLCGGDHTSSRCTNKVCGCCYIPGHTREQCLYRFSNFHCQVCSVRGHMAHRCPDIWRRYHLTTSPELIVKAPRAENVRSLKYCYNCGVEGHFGHECSKPRSDESMPSVPYVISYKDPAKLRNLPLPNIMDLPSCSWPGQNVMSMRRANVGEKIRRKGKRKKQLQKNRLSFQQTDFRRTPKEVTGTMSEQKDRLKFRRFKRKKKAKNICNVSVNSL